MTRWWLLSQLCKHQRVITTRWYFLFHFSSTTGTPATTSTNESLWLIGGFSLDTAGHNKHQRVIKTRWWLLSQPHKHQRVIMTCWCAFFHFLTKFSLTMPATTSTNKSLWLVGGSQHHQAQQAPTSCYDSLVLFFTSCQPFWPQPAPTSRQDLLVASPLTLPGTASTNKLLWLFFASHRPCQPQPAPTSRQDSLVASPSTTQTPTSHYDSLVLFPRR